MTIIDKTSSQLLFALDKISDGVIVVSSNHSVVYVNDTFLHLFPGEGKNSFLEQSTDSLLNHISQGIEHRNDLSIKVVNRFIHRQITTMKPINVEFENVNGRFLRYKDSITPDGYRVGIFSDESSIVALHKQFENACLEAEKLSKAKNSFMAAMSHEVKTPLNAIIGMLDLCVLDDYIAKNDYIKRIQKNADNLLSLINNVLDFAKFDANKVTLSPVTTKLRPLFEEVIENFAGSANQTNTELLLMVDPRLPECALIDDIRLTQVLNNLISNGLKFNRSAHPKLSLTVLYDVEKNHVYCAVKDNGIGISKEQQKYVFGGFEQASTETHRQFGGSGLGLSICQKISWLMGGSLEVSSELNKGTVFTFAFPLNSEARPTPLSHYLGNKLADKKILITDSPYFLKAMNAYKPFFHFKTKFCKELPEHLEDDEVLFANKANARGQDLLNNIEYEGQVFLLSNQKREHRSDYCSNSPLKLNSFIDTILGNFSDVDTNFTPSMNDESGNTSEAGKFSSENPVYGHCKVLVVEDNADNMFVLKRQIEKIGVTADFLLDPLEAPAKFKEESFDVVLSDYQMPGMNGAELISSLRKIEQTDGRAAIPMFVVTADKTQHCLDCCKLAGASDIIMKPLTLHSIAELLQVKNLSESSSTNDMQDDSCDASKFDIAALVDILGEISVEDLRSFFEQYIDNFISAKVELENYAAKKDWIQLGSLAHGMKSSALIIGAKDLNKACQGLEELCQLDIDATQVNTQWQDVQQELNALHGELISYNIDAEMAKNLD
ncbi:response regulator [Glaciecola sp. MH2013]|uniref:hybrid sensor histidine kinase/response regulator n=1 Tax=Glaciecola sp. MH2013 TaxID=2785524 RepID=UPI0018A0ACCD|nr:ATP-binding protein [Glaciecola sp. MH2013]MBF7072720.1 response regulator [Glaciecola sp. MH2013]